MKLTRLIGVAGVAIACLIGTAHAQSASAATLLLFPADGQLMVGETLQVRVAVDSAGQTINTVGGTLSWSAATLQYQSVSTDETINEYWVTEPKLQGASRLEFSGGLPNPGYTGDAGTILTVRFTAVAAGSASLNIQDVTILANDGNGSDASSGQISAEYTISDPTSAAATTDDQPVPVITSPSHPLTTAWYRQPEVQFGWTVPRGLIGVSFSVSQSPDTIPDETMDSNAASSTVTLAADGRWYIHIRGRYLTGWSAAGHFVIRLDRTPPESFSPAIVQDRGLSDPTPELTFATIDIASGLDKYTYTIDGGSTVAAASPVVLSGLPAGTHTVAVTAYDRAGNSRQTSVPLTVEGYPAPTISSIPTALLLFDTLVVRGTAYLGDQVTILVNGQPIGQTAAGPATATSPTNVLVRVPWSFISDQPFRPGTIVVTATATSPDGQVSVTTDPRTIRINGQIIRFYGHALASFSILTPLAVLVISLLLIMVAIMARLTLAVWLMHRHWRLAENDLESLRDVNRRQAIDQRQLEAALERIEDDLDEGRAKRRPASKRPPVKRGR